MVTSCGRYLSSTMVHITLSMAGGGWGGSWKLGMMAGIVAHANRSLLFLGANTCWVVYCTVRGWLSNVYNLFDINIHCNSGIFKYI